MNAKLVVILIGINVFYVPLVIEGTTTPIYISHPVSYFLLLQLAKGLWA